MPAQDSPALSRTLPLAALAVALVLSPIIVGIVLTSGSARAVEQVSAQLSALPDLPGGATAGVAGQGSLVAELRRPTSLRTAPGGRVIGALGLRTQYGSPQVLWVRRSVGGWLGVVSPQAGNGRLGWIPAASAGLSRVDWRIEVSLAARRVVVLHGGQVVARDTVAVGAPYAPTPTGDFAVTDRLQTHDPTGPYGCCILALSAEAPHAIQGWSGGTRIAIHSTPETSSIGLPVSHGCMRLTLAEGRWLIAHVPLGTPTVISSA